jgi:hypothetical protein
LSIHGSVTSIEIGIPRFFGIQGRFLPERRVGDLAAAILDALAPCFLRLESRRADGLLQLGDDALLLLV